MAKSRLIKEFFCLFILLTCAYLIAVNPLLSDSVLDGVNLFIGAVFPALFPYLIITAFLGNLSVIKKGSNLLSPISKKLFRCKGIIFYAYFVSLLSGYPMGSKTVADLKKAGLLNNDESVRASCLCSTSSPVFLIGCVGNLIFKNTVFGVILFLTHFLSSIIIGFIFSFYKSKEKDDFTAILIKESPNGDLFSIAVKNAVWDVLFVGGVITLFYLFTEILVTYNILTPLTKVTSKIFGSEEAGKGLSLGLIECTKGLKTLSIIGINKITLPLCALISGFGGFSVIMQSLPFLKDAKIKTTPFLFAKFGAVIVNFVIGYFFSLLFF